MKLIPYQLRYFIFCLIAVGSSLFPEFSLAQCYVPRANLKALTTRQLNPCQGESVLLEAAYRPDSVSYFWFKDGVQIENESGPVYNATQNGVYHFVYFKSGADSCRSKFYDQVPVNYKEASVSVPQISLSQAPNSSNCYRSFTISSNVNALDTTVNRIWLNDGVPVPAATESSFSGTTPGIYRLRTTPTDTNGCDAISAPLVVQVSGSDAVFIPRIDTASVIKDQAGEQRCQLSLKLKSPVSQRLKNIRILREKLESPAEFELVQTVPVTNDTSYTILDPTSYPWERSYYYRIQPEVSCSSSSDSNFLTAPSKWHKCIHLLITKSQNNYNLLWTPYEGFNLSGYRILCLNANDGLVESISVDSAISSYTYTANNPSVVKFQVEGIAKASDSYNPWGRISANLPRKTKSNTRPTIQSIPGGDSTSLFNKEVVVTSVKDRNPALSFQLYPSPSRDGSCILSIPNHPDAVDLYDATGRKQAATLNRLPGGVRLQASAELQNGLYFVKVRSGGRVSAQRWLLQR